MMKQKSAPDTRILEDKIDYSFPAIERGDSAARTIKRCADIMCASVMLIIALPLLGVLAVLVKRDGGPVLFRQIRAGLNGTTFEIIKLRSMIACSEVVPTALCDQIACPSLSLDKHVTRIGKTMRATHLDEIPQLWNVLCGQMSLVGPRPLVLEEAEQFGPLKSEILSVLPGLTGLWQINKDLAPEFPGRAEMEASYVRRWSLLLDAKIALATAMYIAKLIAREILKMRR